MTAFLLSGTFGALLAAASQWAVASPAGPPDPPEGSGVPDAVDADQQCQAAVSTGDDCFADYFTIYP
ncbi:hypothetical protein [Arthrobacter sp. H-02-3]|uniref:hypothetical protein n=1 Tax=Arthrobacter sp. H-02-3 TaxID=2703675 RepID=UPI001057FD77|nr:hypothetical protein [Arthrobacter sp. H-02-3]